MKYRKLRIAWSAVCGVLCLLLIALWVRSYLRVDQSEVAVSNSSVIGVGYFQGTLIPYTRYNTPPGNLKRWKYQSSAITAPEHQRFEANPEYRGKLGFGIVLNPTFSALSVPLWFCVLVTASLSALTWLRWRFSLRTLLVATTLVAVVLRLVVYAASD